MDSGTIIACIAILLLVALMCVVVTKFASMSIIDEHDIAPKQMRKPTKEEIDYFTRLYCPTGFNIYSKKLKNLKHEWIQTMMVADGVLTDVHESIPLESPDARTISCDFTIDECLYSHKDFNFMNPDDMKVIRQTKQITGYFVPMNNTGYYLLTYSKKI